MSLKDAYNGEPHFPSRALISRSAFEHNLGKARELAGEAQIMAVIKADAYGHGAEKIGEWALDAGVEWLAVAQLGEAIALRKTLHERGRMLALIAEPGAPFWEALELGIDLSVGASWALDEIALAANESKTRARVHIEVDTGMARGGFSLAELPSIIPMIAAYAESGLIETVGLWSHLALADDLESTQTQRQTEDFERAAQLFADAGIEIEFHHLAASAGLLWHPETRFSMVRPGIMLYGLSPAPEVATAEEMGLEPVMRLEADLVSVRDVPAGTGVSYGHTATTQEPMRLGTVPLGYADGIPRHASNSVEVVIGGQRHKLIGRVCMDQFVVAAPDAVAGDTVTLFGASASGFPTADDWAQHCDTIGYEIVSRLGTRVPRYFVD
ncbi:alanine racemase [Arcanobacterium pluranimalium]|uniref:alanine racemase n=1 Tax=Arcanobacterium pluranimalium TaxID=108028 RepID=UPI00195DA4EA|nr:alanine racemase [Arcanobacterium pluranimalium]MBM7824980.1 alanine racemase [Arcanobacterium pluranimalium]